MSREQEPLILGAVSMAEGRRLARLREQAALRANLRDGLAQNTLPQNDLPAFRVREVEHDHSSRLLRSCLACTAAAEAIMANEGLTA